MGERGHGRASAVPGWESSLRQRPCVRQLFSGAGRSGERGYTPRTLRVPDRRGAARRESRSWTCRERVSGSGGRQLRLRCPWRGPGGRSRWRSPHCPAAAHMTSDLLSHPHSQRLCGDRWACGGGRRGPARFHRAAMLGEGAATGPAQNRPTGTGSPVGRSAPACHRRRPNGGRPARTREQLSRIRSRTGWRAPSGVRVSDGGVRDGGGVLCRAVVAAGPRGTGRVPVSGR